MALTAKYDLDIHQLNYKTACLNGPVTDELHLQLPEGADASNLSNIMPQR